MFNVNSTSLTAWRAILGHARNRKVPYMKETAGNLSIELSGETDHVASRFTVAGDSDTGSQGSSGDFQGANQPLHHGFHVELGPMNQIASL